MYTAIHLASELKKDTPKEVIEILNFMSRNSNKEPDILPKHEFFKCERWRFLFTMDSYYFDYHTNCSFEYDGITKSWFLSVTSNLKNYDSEIENFINWIHPYLDKFSGEFLGYTRYEENQIPILIYY